MIVRNLYRAIPDSLPEELIEILAEGPTARIERIVSLGHVTEPGRWYDQDRAEWVALLSGSAMLRFADDEIIRLEAGDHLIIPAGARHRVEQTSIIPPAIWLAVHVDLHAAGQEAASDQQRSG